MGILLSFDPGNTSGVCIARRTQHESGFDLIETLEFTFDTRLLIIETLFTTYRKDIDRIIVEDFILTDIPQVQQMIIDRSRHMPSSRIIGSIENAAYNARIFDKLTLQPNYAMKSINVPSAIASKSSHIQAAYRHLRYAMLVEQRKIDPNDKTDHASRRRRRQ